MSAWTPGPWRVALDHSREDWCLIWGPETEHIASVWWNESATTKAVTRKANAALIAAAPELYEALDWILARHEVLYDRLKSRGDTSQADLEAMNSARAAIAKAGRA